MNRLSVFAVAIVAVLGVATQACSHAVPRAQDAAATAPAARFSIDSKFSALMVDEQARAVVGAFFERRRIAAGQPEMSEAESAGLMEMIGDLTPRELAHFPQANLDDAALEELNRLLAAIPPAAAN